MMEGRKGNLGMRRKKKKRILKQTLILFLKSAVKLYHGLRLPDGPLGSTAAS